MNEIENVIFEDNTLIFILSNLWKESQSSWLFTPIEKRILKTESIEDIKNFKLFVSKYKNLKS
jgi:hypothetical protein